ncbi:hypothetical protein [uncultured Variovorax sp.]|uniref:hypothetical protein n=1 Tax=uncultured Variovorax sp. TaxID=114708 RepID=UPI0026284956|nr:hypothetical protein [uncultured Variovorax sp.]
MLNTDQAPRRRQLSPLAADIEAEFGHLRITRIGPRINAAQVHALRTAIDQAGLTMPKALRPGFFRNCLERLKNHFGLEYRNLSTSQFREALAVISAHIEETRKKIDGVAFEIPKTDNRRWRVSFLGMNNASEEPPRDT